MWKLTALKKVHFTEMGKILGIGDVLMVPAKTPALEKSIRIGLISMVEVKEQPVKELSKAK